MEVPGIRELGAACQRAGAPQSWADTLKVGISSAFFLRNLFSPKNIENLNLSSYTGRTTLRGSTREVTLVLLSCQCGNHGTLLSR